MLRRAVVGALVAASIGLATPPSAQGVSDASPAERPPPTKTVVREYGDGPVSLTKGQRLELSFRGKRGDRVALGVVVAAGGSAPEYGNVEEDDVHVRGRRSAPKPDSAGYFRLSESGTFTIRYRSDSTQHIQLFKQLRVTQEESGTTALPQRRGYQYAVRVRVPQSGPRVVSFGTDLFGVVSKGQYFSDVDGQALVVSPGLPVFDGVGKLSKELKARELIVVMVDPSESGEVVTTVPTDVGRVGLDGPAVSLPGGGAGAVVADLESTDIAASFQQLVNVRLLGEEAKRDWSVMVFPPHRSNATPSAPGDAVDFDDPVPLYQLAITAGTYRVVVFASEPDAAAAQVELDSVANGGTIAVDGPAVTVPAQPDARFTVLDITEPEGSASSYLKVQPANLFDPWTVYAGSLALPNCPGNSGLGCGEGYGVSVSSGFPSLYPQNGGYVVAMPRADQTTGTFTVALTTAKP